MSICKKCAEVADKNRAAWESMPPVRRDNIKRHISWHQHPKDCNCPCQHKPVGDWEDYFSGPRPTVKDNDESEDSDG